MVTLCFVGIFISTFALSLVLAIMSGFEIGTHEKLRSIHPHIIMQPYEGFVNFHKVKQVIKTEFPQIAACAPSAHNQVLLVKQSKKSDPDHTITPQAVLLKAVDPDAEETMQTISKKIIGTPAHTDIAHQLVNLLQDNRIIIGQKYAEQNQLHVGSTMEIWYSDNDQSLSKTITTIGGLFNTGIEEFDYNLAYCSFEFFSTMFPDSGVSHVHMQLTDQAHEDSIMTALKNRFKMSVYSWKDLYPALVSALKLQKYAMFFILALITLVASINMLALLFMYMIQKKADIAILKMLGATHTDIRVIFMIVGMTISFIACTGALLISLVCAALLKRFPFIKLPDSYYVSHLPISLEFYNFVVVFCVTMAISLLACWYATKKNNDAALIAILKGEQ